jgi:hypothetical protein
MTRLGFVTAVAAAALSCSAAWASDTRLACGAMSAVAAPGGGEGIDLRAIDADAADVWTVGRRLDPLGDRTGSPLAMRWDGQTFVEEPVPDLAHLGSRPTVDSVALGPGGEPWAVGGLVDANAGTDVPLILRWSAGLWQSYPITFLSTFAARYARLTDVTSVSADDAWTIGQATSVSRTVEPFTAHWDGTAWTEVEFPGLAGNRYLTAVSAVRDAAFAVGYDAVTPADTIVSTALAAGARETTFARAYIFKGGKWSVVDTPVATKAGSVLTDVIALSVDDVWAVGTAGGTGLFLHWDGNTWSAADAPTGADPRSVDAIASDDVWAAGSHDLYRWNGKGWSVVSALPTDRAASRRMVAVASTCDVWTVTVKETGTGTKSAIERFADTTPSPVPQPPPAPLGLTAWAKSPKEIVLDWVPGASDPTGSITPGAFVIERCVGDANGCVTRFAVIQKVGGLTTQAADFDVATGSSYVYRVYAVNDAGPSQPTAPAFAVIPPATDPPAETVPAPGATTRLEGTVGTTRLATHTPGPVTATSRLATDTPVAEPLGGGAVILNAPPAEPPAMPVGLVAKGESAKKINVYWLSGGDPTDPAGQGWFVIERCVVEGGACVTRFSVVAKVDFGGTSYADTAVNAGTSYAYRVVAVNAAGKSDPTAPKVAATLPAPPASEGVPTGRSTGSK